MRCLFCKKEKPLQKHHISYRPAIVVEICKDCHTEVHKLIDEHRTQTPKQITCHKCDYTWNYKGVSDYYACCPRCHTKIKIGIIPFKQYQQTITDEKKAARSIKESIINFSTSHRK